MTYDCPLSHCLHPDCNLDITLKEALSMHQVFIPLGWVAKMVEWSAAYRLSSTGWLTIKQKPWHPV